MGMAGELREIVDEADNRPMRVLDYRTPPRHSPTNCYNCRTNRGCCTSK